MFAEVKIGLKKNKKIIYLVRELDACELKLCSKA